MRQRLCSNKGIFLQHMTEHELYRYLNKFIFREKHMDNLVGSLRLLL